MKLSIKRALSEINDGTDTLERAIGKLVTKYEETYGVQIEDIYLERDAWPGDEDFYVRPTVEIGFYRRDL